MSYYLEILAVQQPFPIGLDSNSRVMFSCNFDFCATYPLTTFETDIVTILTNASISLSLYNPTTNPTGNIFIGPGAIFPTEYDLCVSIIKTGGVSPYETHNGGKYVRPSVQIITRSMSYVTARDKAESIFNVLDGKRNLTV